MTWDPPRSSSSFEATTVVTIQPRDEAGATVTNDLDADGRALILITGANSGGKSTFLRSVGLAQLLTQAGLPVPARSLRISPATQLLTHFKREEDASIISGKLDEELTRMSNLIANLVPGSLILFNESFASTYEQEGSEIARNIVLALTRRGIRVVFVTHMYQLAKGLEEMHDEAHLFLRTTLTPDGHPTYQLHPGAPEPRSNGIEMYDRVLGCTPVARVLASEEVDREAFKLIGPGRSPAPRAPAGHHMRFTVFRAFQRTADMASCVVGGRGIGGAVRTQPPPWLS